MYAARIGLSQAEFLDMLFGEFMDIVACYQIKYEGAKEQIEESLDVIIDKYV